MITYSYENSIKYYPRGNLHLDLAFHLEAISPVLLLRILLAPDRAVTPLSVDRILQNRLYSSHIRLRSILVVAIILLSRSVPWENGS
jgi:hypothetical protein